METANRTSKMLSGRKATRVEGSILGASLGKLSKTPTELTLARIFEIQLATFCPRKLFYIFLVVEDDDKSAPILDELVETNKNYEEVSSLSFISRNDSFALLDVTENCNFPNHLKPLLLNLIENTNDKNPESASLILEAQLLKLKLIQVMYQQYVNQVRKNEKEKNLEALLGTLSKECKKRQKKEDNFRDEEDEKIKSPAKDDTKNVKKNKKDDKKDPAKDEEIDYTTIPIEIDDISYDENIFDYIWFYCIKGYYNAAIIQCLIDQVNVPISGVIKFSENDDKVQLQSDQLKSFWNEIKQYFFQNTTMYRSLENTILMQFTTSTAAKEKILIGLEEFVYMLRKIVNLKLTYLKYLRHLKINKIQHTYRVTSLECLRRYNKILKHFCTDSINTELILDSILQEVCSILDPEDISDTSSLNNHVLNKPSHKDIRYVDPLPDFQTFTKLKTKESSLKGLNINRFLVHENDLLTKILKSYQYIGPKIVDTTLNIIRQMPVFCQFDDYNKSITDQIVHLHDVNPSDELKKAQDDVLDYFMYIFLFNTFTKKVKSLESIPCDLSVNMLTFNMKQFWEDAQPKMDGEQTDSRENIYDTLAIHFRWKEILKQDLLLQEVFAAWKEFLYMDRKYSPETDNFLVVFSDRLDDFGINTKLVDVQLHTPICIRDFCRYVLDKEARWLQENRLKVDESTFKIVFDEHCPGVKNALINLQLFQEYVYLLDKNVKENIEENATENIVLEQGFVKENFIQEMSFLDMFSDLQKCSSSMNIVQECHNSVAGQNILAYDLGTNVLKVHGKVTTFCSHDNVKVTVDNTGFLQFPAKCTFNVFSEGHNLTVHSRKFLSSDPFVTTLQLKDGSRISFIISKDSTEPLGDTEHENANQATGNNDDESSQIKNSTVLDIELEANGDEYVHYVDEGFIKELLGIESLDDLLSHGDEEDLLEYLSKDRENASTIYKVNVKSSFLERKYNTLKVPLKNALKNLLPFENIPFNHPKHHELYTKRYEFSQDDKSSLNVKHPVDFRICLPNGLFIRAHPCVINDEFLMIKQEYVEEKPPVTTIGHEEFRLFSSQGLILIKKVDGTVTILKSNGDVINFEKPTDSSEENYSVNPCHYSNLNDFRKKLNKLLKDQEVCDYIISRRGHITSKQNHILDDKILKVLEEFNVPYTKLTITKFDGKRIKVQGDKITQKQLFHLTSQQDFFTGEIFFERDDNFRSMFDRYGSQKYIFPDGTIISNSMEVDDELIHDFVNVKLSYQYEHLYYATVKYNFDKTPQIELNSNVVIKGNVNSSGFSVEIDKTFLTSVSNENIIFQKTCLQCNGQFQASFNIKPFRNESWNPNEDFMCVKDSYGKCFSSDFIGNCTRNNDYVKGKINSMKCDHFKETRYKKLFVIDRNLTGYMCLTNNDVKTKIRQMKNQPNAFVDTYTMSSNNNITVVDCRQKFYVRHSDRFYNNSIEQTFNPFQKIIKPKYEIYTTFRVFHKMFQTLNEIASHVSNLKHIFFSDTLNPLDDSIVCNNISALVNALELCYETNQEEVVAENQGNIYSEDFEKKNPFSICKCIKNTMTVTEKISEWRKCCYRLRGKIRNGKIPVYFKSEFCQIDK